MKNVMKTLIVAGAMVAAGSAAADFGDVKFSLGADYLQAWTKGKNVNATQNFGDAFPKSYPGATVYVGAKFAENFGIEAGYDFSGKKKKTLKNVTSKVSFNGFHLDLVGFMPISGDCFELFGTLGLGWVKPKVATNSTVAGATAPLAYTGKGKTIVRLGLGANYMLTDIFGLRAKVGYETTSALRLKNAGTSYKAFKDSFTTAVGVFAKF